MHRIGQKLGITTEWDVGRKDDAEKLARFDLLPTEAITALAELYGRGAKKYDDRNWEKGIRFHRVFRALLGHIWAWWGGEEYDREDGQHHLDSVAWNAFALRTYIARNMTHLDDRPKPFVDNTAADVKAEGAFQEWKQQS